MSPKNWDDILRDYSSGEDSDSGDVLNVEMVKKNAHKVVNLLRGTVLGEDITKLPKGMNNVNAIRDGLATATAASSHRSPDERSCPVSSTRDASCPPKT
jgi:hypothetical protein